MRAAHRPLVAPAAIVSIGVPPSNIGSEGGIAPYALTIGVAGVLIAAALAETAFGVSKGTRIWTTGARIGAGSSPAGNRRLQTGERPSFQ